MSQKKKIKKKQKSKNNRKHLFSLLLLLFTLCITLTTSSYAWFTSNRIATVWLMDVKVAAQNGVEISADAINWNAEIAIEDLVEAHNTYPSSVNQLPTIMEPVSTVGDVNDGFLNMFYGKVENSRKNGIKFTLRANQLEETRGAGDAFDGKFLAFDIFLKTTTPTELYLTSESGASYSGEISSGLENSMRFAFVVEGNVPTESGAAAQRLKTSQNSNVYIWEPNYDIHTESAIKNAKDVYGLDVKSPSGVIPYEGVKAEIKKDDNVTIDIANKKNFPKLFDDVKVDYASKVDFEDYIKVFSVSSGITKIRVYMWLEGQDIDCENNAAVGGMHLNLQFTTNPS